MKIVDYLGEQEKVISVDQAKERVEQVVNNETKDYLYVLKFDGKIISISGEYYKFAWKKIGMLKNALINKFGKELADALVESNIIEIYKIYI